MKFLYLIVFSLLTSLSTQAEDVIGKVLEKKNNKSVPLVGVNVYWARTTIGTITDTNGQFTINKINDSHQQLVFSYVGYQNDTITISDSNSLTVFLKPVQHWER